MKYRLISYLVLLFAIITLPFWFVMLLTAMCLFIFSKPFYEALIVGFLIEFLFGQTTVSFGEFLFGPFMISFYVTLLILLVRDFTMIRLRI